MQFILLENRIDNLTMPAVMEPNHLLTPVEQIAERVERLVLRHEALLSSYAQLREEAGALLLERDSLKSRLAASRARVEALLGRLPENSGLAPLSGFMPPR